MGEPNKLSLVMAYYRAPLMLKRHTETWGLYSEYVKKRLRVILVDDGSPEPITPPAVKGVEVHVFRIKQNIPWNMDGARNLAMFHCPDKFALMTDMDHLLEPGEAEKLIRNPWLRGYFYYPSRVDIHGNEQKRHPNSFVLAVEDFWRIGGYDEDFAGYYGSDANFVKNLRGVAKPIEVDVFALRHYQGVVPDASTSDWGRKTPEYHARNNKYLIGKRARPPYFAENPLRFDWERLQ